MVRTLTKLSLILIILLLAAALTRADSLNSIVVEDFPVNNTYMEQQDAWGYFTLNGQLYSFYDQLFVNVTHDNFGLDLFSGTVYGYTDITGPGTSIYQPFTESLYDAPFPVDVINEFASYPALANTSLAPLADSIADPASYPASVPEPSTRTLMLIGISEIAIFVLLVNRKSKSRRPI
jgi:hypothetical protein